MYVACLVIWFFYICLYCIQIHYHILCDTIMLLFLLRPKEEEQLHIFLHVNIRTILNLSPLKWLCHDTTKVVKTKTMLNPHQSENRNINSLLSCRIIADINLEIWSYSIDGEQPSPRRNYYSTWYIVCGEVSVWLTQQRIVCIHVSYVKPLLFIIKQNNYI